MNKQEAIDSLECFRRNTAHILGDNDEKVKTIETCIMLVKEAEEAPSVQSKPQWIPRAKRLPEVFADDEYFDDETELMIQHYSSEPVLVCKENSDLDVMWFSRAEGLDSGKIVCEGFPDERLDNLVIAWMPLPESYKEESH